MYRSLAATLLTFAAVGTATVDIAGAQAIYVSPGATVNIYVTPAPGNGPYAPPVVYGPGDVQAPPAAYPTTYGGYGASVYVTPPQGYAPPPAYNGNAPISAYAAQAPARGPNYMPRRIIVEDLPRPPAPVPYGYRAR